MRPEERFWLKVNKTENCWEWTASTAGRGYGQFSPGGGKQGYAHRFAWELENGPIAAGLEVDHICHNRRCVRVEHLRLVDRKRNMENVSGPYANSKSGIRGVWRVERLNKWTAAVRHDKRTINLGLFLTAAEAESAVVAKRLELFTHNEADRRAA